MSVIEQKEDWILQRQQGLGGTDIAAICGLHPYKTAIQVYLGKTGQSEPIDITPAMWWGTYLEEGVAQRYSNLTGLEVARGEAIAEFFPENQAGRFNGQVVVRHPEFPEILGTPDGIVPNDEHGKVKGLEIKTAGFRSKDWGRSGTDEVPAHYLMQCSWYMLVTRLERWDLSVLFHGNEDAIYRMKRNDELEKQMLDAGRAFWHDNVLARVPPDVDSSESYGRYLARRFSVGNGIVIAETPEIFDWATKLKTDAELKKQCESNIQLAKNHLAAMIGENAGCKTQLGKIGWVRPTKESTNIDYETAFNELQAAVQKNKKYSALAVDLIAKHSTTKTASPYIRGWFTKEEE